MTDELSDSDRIQIARSAARDLGYMLFVHEAPNMGEITHMAVAARHIENQPAVGRFLTYSTSAPDAAEAGLEVLRGIVERGDQWPQG